MSKSKASHAEPHSASAPAALPPIDVRPACLHDGALPERRRAALNARSLGLAHLAALVLVAAAVLSLLIGSHPLPPDEVWRLLWHPDDTTASSIVNDQRLPRTVLAAAVGAALGTAGAVMQGLTRNPLADPGVLGVNAGASLLVVTAVAIGGTLDVRSYLWFALAGAAVAAVGVYALAGTGKPSTPARLALAGVAVSAALAAITQTVILADQEAFNEFRTWVGGSLEGRGWSVLTTVAPLLLLGGVLSAVIAPALGTLALGDETAHGLGVHVARTRVLALVAVTLLAGASTAAVGPIGFVGLAVPMLARKVVGHDQRWVTASSMLLGATALLLADVLARVVLGHQEVQAGLIAAVVGGPVFVAVVRRRKVPAL